MGKSKSCRCGDKTMTVVDLANSRSFCCSPEWPCEDQGSEVVCPNGTLVNINDKCRKRCPAAGLVSATAIATKEACDEENKCFQNKDLGYNVNEVCDHDQQKDEISFAEKFCGFNDSVPCFNNATTGLYNISQCYNPR